MYPSSAKTVPSFRYQGNMASQPGNASFTSEYTSQLSDVTSTQKHMTSSPSNINNFRAAANLTGSSMNVGTMSSVPVRDRLHTSMTSLPTYSGLTPSVPQAVPISSGTPGILPQAVPISAGTPGILPSGQTNVNSKPGLTLLQIRDLLQERVGLTPKFEIEKFENWVGGQAQDWVFAVRPVTVTEVQLVVKAARALGLKVRGAASTHSWSPIFSDRGQIVVYVKQLQRPEGPRIQLEPEDPAYPGWKLVTMVTGVTTGEFLQYQVENDICLSTNVILREVTMGGVILGGCHGAGWNMKSVSDHVVRMRIVNSDGNLVEYSDVIDPEMMRAVKCNLGLFGIVVDFTLKVEPMLYVQTQNIWMKMGDFFYNQKNLYEILRTNWSVEAFWFPFNSIRPIEAVEAMLQRDVDFDDWDPKEDEVLLRLVNSVNTSVSSVEHTFYEDESYTSWLQCKSLYVAEKLVKSFPNTTPAYIRSQMSFLKEQFRGAVVQRLPHAIHFRDYINHVQVHDMEWSFNISPDCSNICTATQKVVELVQKEAKAGRFPLNLPLEMRFIADSQAYLAPASAADPQNGGSGHTCYIEILSLIGTPGWEEFCGKVAYIWRQLSGARPHWCKEWSFLPKIEQFIKKAYRNQIPRFLCALQRSGADPNGMFCNQYMEKLLYPDGRQSYTTNTPYTTLYPEPPKYKKSTCVLL